MSTSGGDRLAVTCDNCGRSFESRAVSFGVSSGRVSIEGSVERCPYCRGWARLPNATFEVRLGRVVRVLRNSSVEDLLLLRERLQHARTDPSRVIAELEHTEGPGAVVGAWLRERENRNEVALWLGLIIALLTLIATVRGSGPEPEPPVCVCQPRLAPP